MDTRFYIFIFCICLFGLCIGFDGNNNVILEQASRFLKILFFSKTEQVCTIKTWNWDSIASHLGYMFIMALQTVRILVRFSIDTLTASRNFLLLESLHFEFSLCEPQGVQALKLID
jgi:hypothetical protein